MLRSTTIAGLVTVLAVSFVLGQDTPSNPDVVPYKWSTLISIPVVPSGYSEFLTGSIARQLSRPVIIQRPGLSQQIRFGVWAATTQEWDSGQGLGYMVNGGLRLELWRLVGELRANLNNGQPKPVITADIGFRTKSLIGATALPVGAIILLMVALIGLAGSMF